ncbi:hypothetical protein Gorai_004462 [Gossypium raimondii]|uniref:CCHC-type domain-containing protein n=1 Tax=Gossypium raimondii TaxID=29730 RepID=A0A7J8QI96_GOSRA|nr:hypothetical protein [Gossypium raimondii]
MVEGGSDNISTEDHNTVKVRFKGLTVDTGSDMAGDLSPVPMMSWRDKVMGRGSPNPVCDEDFKLPGFLYKRRILEEIGGLVDKVAKLDFKIDSGSRGRFARMAVFINLEKLLISQILVNGTVHRVEYEVLSAVCFACDRYGHVQDLCPFVGSMTDGGGSKAETTINIPEK